MIRGILNYNVHTMGYCFQKIFLTDMCWFFCCFFFYRKTPSIEKNFYFRINRKKKKNEILIYSCAATEVGIDLIEGKIALC